MTEKKVNYGVAGLEDLVGDINGNNEQGGAIAVPTTPKRTAGRPKVHAKPLERTSITLDSEVMGKLRSLALNTGRQLNAIIEEALLDYFKGYEKKNGEIVIPEIYRKSE